MKVIIVNNIAKGEMAPFGGLLFWSGKATEVPPGWTIFNGANDAFIMGTDTAGISLTKAGASTHKHTNNNTNSGGVHTHYRSTQSYYGSTSTKGLANNGTGGSSVIPNHEHSISDETSIGNSSSHYHTVNDTDSQYNLPPYIRYYLMSTNSEPVPIGAIVIWSGSAESIPENWHICDGSNVNGINLPDIRNRFIYLPTNDTYQGLSGGGSIHNHASLYTNSAGNHSHSVYFAYGAPSSSIILKPGTAGGSASTGTHQHPGFSTVTNSTGSHKHVIFFNQVEILPPYMKLYFIEKVR